MNSFAKKVGFVLVGLAWALPVQAATYTVDRTDDVHTAVATACSDSVANDCSLRDAIRKANQNAEASNAITVPAGVYTLTLTSPGEDNAYNGDLDINKDLTIDGAGADPDCGAGSTCVDGGGATIGENAFSVFGAADVTFRGLTIRNSIHSGIQIDTTSSGAGGLVTVDRCVLKGHNQGLDTLGPGGEIRVVDSKIVGNASGGGVYNNNFKVTIQGSTISGNSSVGPGGGVFNGGSGDMTIANSTLSGNSTILGGGGVSNTASLVLRNVTITDNHADTGGGIYTEGDVLFENSIIAGNTGVAKGPDCMKHATLGLYDSKGHNLIGTKTNCVLTPATTDLVGDNTTPLDPKLGPLAANGGLWETHLPADDSPVVDAGDPAGCFDADGPRTADQRGEPSPADGNDDGDSVCDIGAVEVQPEGSTTGATAGGTTAGGTTSGSTAGTAGTGGGTATGGTSGTSGDSGGGCSLIMNVNTGGNR